MNRSKYVIAGMVCLLAGLLAWPAVAGELKPGTAINASNFDSLKNETFEGHTIASMVTDKMEIMIRKWGMVLKLKNSKEVPVDPRLIEATKKYAGQAKYDTKSRLVTGYKAGVPFPDVTQDDPNAGDKVMWNHHYGAPHGDVMDFRKFAYLLIDGNRGLERTQHWFFIRAFLKGKLASANPIEGDGSVISKTLLFCTYPADIKGLGTFAIRYDDGRVEDNWAYIKTVRRTRRLSGGAWMDPIGGTDQLNDDIEIFNAFPTWYPKFKVLGKRWILAVANAAPLSWDESKKGTPAEWPMVDLKTAPYWNFTEGYEPREVWIVEGTTPKEHPYSKKIMYMDTKIHRAYYAEAYDRKGEFWKFMNFVLKPYKGDDGSPAVVSAMGNTIDMQRRHATIFVSHPSWRINPVGISGESVTLGKLEEAGQGK
jgi:hypothetical protein